MNDKVYFIHQGGIGLAADFFEKGLKPEEVDEYGIDYFMSDCEYVIAFKKLHPEYTYVDSTDNMHYHGWGASFEDYEEVECPEIEESD